ncbi:hypothetical protein LPJ57_007759 [Coemansia sp. RSA 486]|nr:hypothetical protein LPJ57_007759 [Coemansia sp. RSA 486]
MLKALQSPGGSPEACCQRWRPPARQRGCPAPNRPPATRPQTSRAAVRATWSREANHPIICRRAAGPLAASAGQSASAGGMGGCAIAALAQRAAQCEAFSAAPALSAGAAGGGQPFSSWAGQRPRRTFFFSFLLSPSLSVQPNASFPASPQPPLLPR